MLRQKMQISLLSQILPEDLVKFGLIPELVGRIPVITGLKALDEEALIRILVEPKTPLSNSIRSCLRWTTFS